MGIKAHGIGSVSKFFKGYMKIVHEEVTRTLSYLGEQCVRHARDRAQEDSWYDHTGNLRSSIGYAIYEKGRKTIESEFPIVKEGADGADEGRRMLDDLARMYSDTYTLVVVAAMNYAEFVESLDNKDVLASAELMAQSKINEYLVRTKRLVEQRVERELRF